MRVPPLRQEFRVAVASGDGRKCLLRYHPSSSHPIFIVGGGTGMAMTDRGDPLRQCRGVRRCRRAGVEGKFGEGRSPRSERSKTKVWIVVIMGFLAPKLSNASYTLLRSPGRHDCAVRSRND
jgi:hypothetical protein